MGRIRKLRKNKENTKKKINKIKSLVLKLSLIMLNFIFATFAWFVYERTLEANVDVKVSAWRVDFKEGTNDLETLVEFELENFYPGMPNYVKTIDIENLGDRAASISYEIEDLTILGEEYIVKETAEAGDSANTVYCSKVVQSGKEIVKILNDTTTFPFEITLMYSQEIYTPSASSPNRNKGTFQITLSWPYESTGTETEKQQKNALDTKWGHDIANFYKNLPAGSEEHGIEISINAIAKQIID